MRTAIGLGLVGLLWALSLQRVPMFQSDRALWEAAVAASPLLPRPAVNLAAAYHREGRNREAVVWLVKAGELSPGAPRGVEVRWIVRRQLLWMTAFGDPVCSRQSVAPYCF